jgi:hypothetical protein
VLVWLKSWIELIHLGFYTCEEHARELKEAEAIVHENELFMLAPSAELAAAARTELKRSRGTGATKPIDTTSSALDSKALGEDAMHDAVQSIIERHTKDLPPILLDNEDDSDVSSRHPLPDSQSVDQRQPER